MMKLLPGEAFCLGSTARNDLHGSLPLWETADPERAATWVGCPDRHVYLVISTRRCIGELQYLIVSAGGMGWFTDGCVEVVRC